MKDLEKNILNHLEKHLISPLFSEFKKYHDIEDFRVFTKELADVFEKHFPEYFELDYYQWVGKYFYCTHFGEAMTKESILKDYIVNLEDEETRERYDAALSVYFENSEGMDYLFEDYVKGNNENIDLSTFEDVFIVETIKYLNSKLKPT